MLGWFGRKRKLPYGMIRLDTLPVGNDGAPVWTSEIENATKRFGPEFVAPAMYEQTPGQCLGIVVAKTTYQTPVRAYEGRATMIQRKNDEFRTTVVITAPAAPDKDYPWDAYRVEYMDSISEDEAKGIVRLMRPLCEKAHTDERTRQRQNSLDAAGIKPPSRKGWQLELVEEKDEWPRISGEVFRRYEFSGVPTPALTTSLRIGVHAYRQPNGSVSTTIRFELRPYLYLIPDQRPIGEPGSIVSVPFHVALWAAAAGAGTEESPTFQGGLIGVYGFSIEEDPETVILGNDARATVMQCVQAISTGTELSFSIYDDQAQPPVKLGLRLPNDQEFAQLYSKLLDHL